MLMTLLLSSAPLPPQVLSHSEGRLLRLSDVCLLLPLPAGADEEQQEEAAIAVVAPHGLDGAAGSRQAAALPPPPSGGRLQGPLGGPDLPTVHQPAPHPGGQEGLSWRGRRCGT